MLSITNSPQWKSLQARVESKKLPHALLLTGPRGVGKMRFARHLATSLLCNLPQIDTGAACGECGACKLVAAGSHADYVEVSPQEDSRVIKIRRIRALCEQLSLTAQLGGYRVALINPADAMHASAANSLLKTLEEPQPGVVIILISSKLGTIPVTIRSRCQRVRLNLAGNEGAPVSDDVAPNEYLHQWQAGLARRRDYISIAAEWSKADHEAIFQPIFAWLTAHIRRGIADDGGSPTDANDGSGIFSPETAKMESRKLFGFYDKLLAAYQLATKPGINRRALYEQLFIQSQAVKHWSSGDVHSS